MKTKLELKGVVNPSLMASWLVNAELRIYSDL